MNKTKILQRIGYVIASPAEFAIHRRLGKTIHCGRGIGFIKLPLIDHYSLIPSTTQTVGFTAEQITAENQGVEVSGFAAWRIADPEKAAAAFEFAGERPAMETIGATLKRVVESAIRHQVANMTLEAVLRARKAMITELKQELEEIAEQWGLVIETVEIRTVRILSTQLFAQMQARFRDATRLTSEISAMETERQIAQERLKQREEIAMKEQDFQHRELERKAESARKKADTDFAQEMIHKNHELELVKEDHLLQAARATLETARHEERTAHGLIDDALKRRQIETANQEDTSLVLLKSLPMVANALQIKELNIREDTLGLLARELMRVAGKGERHE